VLTESLFCSFVDRDMFMRHFSHGVGHLQYERQHENEPDHDTSMGGTLEDGSESSESSDNLDPGDSDPDELEIVEVDPNEEEGDNEEIVEDEGDASDSDIIVSDSGSDVDGSDCGYASY